MCDCVHERQALRVTAVRLSYVITKVVVDVCFLPFTSAAADAVVLPESAVKAIFTTWQDVAGHLKGTVLEVRSCSSLVGAIPLF